MAKKIDVSFYFSKSAMELMKKIGNYAVISRQLHGPKLVTVVTVVQNKADLYESRLIDQGGTLKINGMGDETLSVLNMVDQKKYMLNQLTNNIFELKEFSAILDVHFGGTNSTPTVKPNINGSIKAQYRRANVENPSKTAHLIENTAEELSRKMRLATEKTYRKEKHNIDPTSSRGPYIHLGHKLSIDDAIKNNVPIHVVANSANLEMQTKASNLSNGTKSSITVEELTKKLV